MRFIMTCMVIVGLCLLAMPLIPAFNGIEKERDAILANAATGANLAVPPPVDQNTLPDTLMAADQDGSAVSTIEPAAGTDMTVTPDTFTGGFTGKAPSALAEPATTPPVDATQDAAQ